MKPPKDRDTNNETKRDNLIIGMPFHHIQPYSGQDKDKLSTGLPLPALPPINSLSKQLVPNSEIKGFSELSAVDLKAIDTDVSKQHVQHVQHIENSEQEFQYPVIDNNEWNEFLSNRERANKELDNHKAKDCNWNNYNLNAIDKYIWRGNEAKIKLLSELKNSQIIDKAHE